MTSLLKYLYLHFILEEVKVFFLGDFRAEVYKGAKEKQGTRLPPLL